MVLEATKIMVPLTAVSFLRSLEQQNTIDKEIAVEMFFGILSYKTQGVPYLYSILPDVGSNIIHLSFHFRSCLKEDNISSKLKLVDNCSQVS